MPFISFGANSFYRLLAKRLKPSWLLLFGINSLSSSLRAVAKSTCCWFKREFNYLKSKAFIKSIVRKEKLTAIRMLPLKPGSRK